MNKYNFDKIVDRKNTDSLKWADKRDNALPMWVADMDFPVFEEIKKAIIDRLDVPAFGYVDVPDSYFEAYASWWNSRHDLNLSKDDLLFSSGVIASIDSIFKHLIKKGTSVALFTPVYPTFFNCIKNNELNAVEIPFIYTDKHYEIDWDKFESVLSREDVNVFLLCNPHNPTGHIFSKYELNMIAKVAKDNNVLIISDEIHCDIVSPNQKYCSILSLDEKVFDNIVALFSPSKAFNVASIHASCVATKDKELREKIQNGLYADDIGEPNYFACAVAMSAYNKGAAWIDELNQYIEGNKKLVFDFINKELPNINVIAEGATYLMWLDISYLNIPSEQFTKEISSKTGLILSSGHRFRGNGNNFVRLNVATNKDNVLDGLNRLKSFIEQLNKKALY